MNVLDNTSRINYESILKELLLLTNKWDIYRELFVNSNNAKVLWEASDLIYSVFIESLRDDFIITISRLTDKRVMGSNNKCSTLDRLQEDVKELIKERKERNYNESNQIHRLRKVKEEQKFKELKIQFEDLTKKIKPIRKLRNKRKAHRDLDTIIQDHSKEFNGISREGFDSDIKNSIEAINNVVKLCSNIANHNSWIDGSVSPPKDVKYFIENLEEGNNWREAYIKSLITKSVTPINPPSNKVS